MRKELDSDFNLELIYAETLDFFKRNIKNGTHIAFVCEYGRQLIATVGITLFEMMPTTKYPNGKVARLINMYVVPFYRHQGIAKELLNCAMMYAREHKIGKVMLNPSLMGKSLYENYGFQLLADEIRVDGKLLYDLLIAEHFPYAVWHFPLGSLFSILVFVSLAAVAAIHTPVKRIRNMSLHRSNQ